MKYKPISKYKAELDKVFSLYIRSKYPKRCFTCGKGDRLQNGHFITRNHLFSRWEEDNCRPQCSGCNLYGGGKPLDFEENLIKEVGAERIQELKDHRHDVIKLTPDWYVEQIALYKNKLKALQ